jgi:hypothetical protein
MLRHQPRDNGDVARESRSRFDITKRSLRDAHAKGAASPEKGLQSGLAFTPRDMEIPIVAALPQHF